MGVRARPGAGVSSGMLMTMRFSRPVALLVGLVSVAVITLNLRAYPEFIKPLLLGLAIGALAAVGGVVVGLVAVGIKRMTTAGHTEPSR
jgi:hypothetical protein